MVWLTNRIKRTTCWWSVQLLQAVRQKKSAILRAFKATISFREDWLGLPCLVQLLTWLHVSDYHKIWNNERWESLTNTLASNKYLCHRDIFQNGVNTFSKIVINHFCQRAQNFVYFTNTWSKYLPNNVWKDFMLPISASAMVTWNAPGENIFWSKFAIKFLRVTFENANTGSLKSLHKSFDMYLDQMRAKFEPNRMV